MLDTKAVNIGRKSTNNLRYEERMRARERERKKERERYIDGSSSGGRINGSLTVPQ